MAKSIAVLWHEVIQGSALAWTELVRRLSPLVFAVVRRAGLEQTGAEDCVQRTWLALYRGRHNIKDPLRLPAWLIRVSSRMARRQIEAQARRNRLADRLDPPRPGKLPDEDLQALERITQLNLGLEQLDERCRRVLTAVFFSPPEKTYEQIAADLGLPANSLGPTRMRCLKKLRKILESFEYW